MIVLLRCTCEGFTHARHLTPQYLSRSCCILCIGRFFSSACSLADDFKVWVSALSIYFPQVFRPLSCEDLSLGLLFSFNIIRLCCIALSLQCAKGRRLNHHCIKKDGALVFWNVIITNPSAPATSGLLLKRFCETVFIDSNKSLQVEGVFTSRIVSERGLFLARTLFFLLFLSALWREDVKQCV